MDINNDNWQAIQKRADLQVVESRDSDRQLLFVVKDPVAQKYFQLTEHAYFVLQSLDGQKSIETIRDEYHRKFAPQRIELRRLEKLLFQFHRDGLVISTRAGQGKQLFDRQRRQKNMELFGKFSNVLAIRFRGFDPEHLLTNLNRLIGWVFSRWVVMGVLVASAIVLSMTLARLPLLFEDMQDVNTFFQLDNLLLFFVVFSATKMLHEFGHGISCKRLGGECHEIGFMLLVMTPCLFCNVSDSWMLKNKWHRMAISAAGMYVELILATVAAIVWMNTAGGWVQIVAIQVMLLCSVSTLVFNGNPLLRFDGYYILSDFLEIPNLMQRSQAALKHWLLRAFFGFDSNHNDLPAKNRLWFVLFGILSSLYRWVILFSITWFLCTWLEPRGMKSLGVVIAVFAIFGMVIWPAVKTIRFVQVPGCWQQLSLMRFGAISAGLAITITGLGLIPLPHYVHCDVVMMPDTMRTVFAQQPGTLEQVFVEPGHPVIAGQVIARIRNDDLTKRKIELVSRLRQAESELQYVSVQEDREFFGPNRANNLKTRILGVKQLISAVERQQQTQEIVSEIDGCVLSVHQAGSQEASSMFDSRSTGTHQSHVLLAENNVGIFLKKGAKICDVVDDRAWNAIVLVSEPQVDLIEQGQIARIRLADNPYRELSGVVEATGSSDKLLSAGGLQHAQNVSEASGPTIVETLVSKRRKEGLSYLASIKIGATDRSIRVGSSGKVRLFCGYTSLGWRLSRYVRRHFQ